MVTALMRTRITTMGIVAAFTLCGFAADTPVLPHWSAIKVLVLDDATGRPVAGAVVEQLCRSCAYASDRPMTDTNGVARAMVYDKWVLLKVTKDGLTNSIRLEGNEMEAFRTNAIVRLRKGLK